MAAALSGCTRHAVCWATTTFSCPARFRESSRRCCRGCCPCVGEVGRREPETPSRLGAWEAVHTPEGGAQRIAGPRVARKDGTGPRSPQPPLSRSPESQRGPRVWHATCGPGLRPVARQRAATLPSGREAGRFLRGGGRSCDPMSLCNHVLVCSDTDPTVGGCPISRAS